MERALSRASMRISGASRAYKLLVVLSLLLCVGSVIIGALSVKYRIFAEWRGRVGDTAQRGRRVECAVLRVKVEDWTYCFPSCRRSRVIGITNGGHAEARWTHDVSRRSEWSEPES